MRALLCLAVLVFTVTSCKTVKQKPMVDDTELTESENETESEEDVAPTDERPSESEIDLGLEGSGSGRIKVNVANDEPAAEDDGLDWSCSKASDCRGRGLPRKKTGGWRCEENQCVFLAGTEGMKAEPLSLDE